MPVLAAIPTPPFDGIQLGPLDLRMYGVVIAVGAYLALRMTVRRYAATGGDPNIAERTGLLALLGGFLGARIGYVIPRFLGEGGFVERPLDILAIWQGGLAFFGGLVGGALAAIVYLRVKKIPLAPMADAIAPALPLAQAFGRWGNYFNQELFGRPTDLPWALQVDPGPAERAGFPGDSTFHPTFLYESLWNLGLVWLILELDRRGAVRRRGSLFFVYLIGYGAGRGWVEALRVDTVERYLGLSRNNWIAIAVVLLGIAGLVWWERRGSAPLRNDPDPEAVAADLTERAAADPAIVAEVEDADGDLPGDDASHDDAAGDGAPGDGTPDTDVRHDDASGDHARTDLDVAIGPLDAEPDVDPDVDPETGHDDLDGGDTDRGDGPADRT